MGRIDSRIELPSKYKSWKEYTKVLLKNLPEEEAREYKRKFKKSIVFWRKKGGALDTNTINTLIEAGVKLEISPCKRWPEKKIVKLAQATPDENAAAILSKTPSWKRMCICILKKDIECSYMGF